MPQLIRRPRSRLPSWLALLVASSIGSAITIAASTTLLRTRYLRIAVAGESMTPALQPDEFLVLRSGPPSQAHAYGQIVAIRDPRPEAGDRILLKRIVGLPDDSLRVGGAVQVNSRVLDEPYAHGETPFEQHRGINRLAPDEYFLLGDHRGASTDSRDFGPVRRDAIIGTAVFRYWPPERFGRLQPPPRVLFGVDEPDSVPLTHPLPWVQTREATTPGDTEPAGNP